MGEWRESLGFKTVVISGKERKGKEREREREKVVIDSQYFASASCTVPGIRRRCTVWMRPWAAPVLLAAPAGPKLCRGKERTCMLAVAKERVGEREKSVFASKAKLFDRSLSFFPWLQFQCKTAQAIWRWRWGREDTRNVAAPLSWCFRMLSEPEWVVQRPFFVHQQAKCVEKRSLRGLVKPRSLDGAPKAQAWRAAQVFEE